MTENKRYEVKGSDDFFQHIEDTTLSEDRHEGAIYNIYQVVNRLNKQDDKIKKQSETISEQAIQLDFLKNENQQIKDVLDENKQLKERIKELEEELATYKRKFLDCVDRKMNGDDVE